MAVKLVVRQGTCALNYPVLFIIRFTCVPYFMEKQARTTHLQRERKKKKGENINFTLNTVNKTLIMLLSQTDKARMTFSIV